MQVDPEPIEDGFARFRRFLRTFTRVVTVATAGAGERQKQAGMVKWQLAKTIWAKPFCQRA